MESDNVMRRGMKHGAITVKIQHSAGMDAANTINVKQRQRIDFGAVHGSTFVHRNTQKKQNLEALNGQGQLSRSTLPRGRVAVSDAAGVPFRDGVQQDNAAVGTA
jgi:hypothetical protein